MRKIASAFLLWILLILSVSCGGGGPTQPPINGDGRVENYTLLYPDKICRWDTTAFPLKVFVDPAPTQAGPFGPTLRAAAVAAIDTWDNVIVGIPDVFNHETDYDSADIIVRWETMSIDGYTRATEYEDHVAIHKIALSDQIGDPASAALIMGHELGHVLGLNLSGVPGDLMHSHVDPQKTTLTQRDRDMINWLYSRENYIPILTY